MHLGETDGVRIDGGVESRGSSSEIGCRRGSAAGNELVNLDDAIVGSSVSEGGFHEALGEENSWVSELGAHEDTGGSLIGLLVELEGSIGGGAGARPKADAGKGFDEHVTEIGTRVDIFISCTVPSVKLIASCVSGILRTSKFEHGLMENAIIGILGLDDSGDSTLEHLSTLEALSALTAASRPEVDNCVILSGDWARL